MSMVSTWGFNQVSTVSHGINNSTSYNEVLTNFMLSPYIWVTVSHGINKDLLYYEVIPCCVSTQTIVSTVNNCQWNWNLYWIWKWNWRTKKNLENCIFQVNNFSFQFCLTNLWTLRGNLEHLGQLHPLISLKSKSLRTCFLQTAKSIYIEYWY